jgi:hypothetical protein
VQVSRNYQGNELFSQKKLMNRLHRSHGPAARRRSMVHGGPWTGAQPELTVVRAHQRYSGLELAAAASKWRGELTGSYRLLGWMVERL